MEIFKYDKMMVLLLYLETLSDRTTLIPVVILHA